MKKSKYTERVFVSLSEEQYFWLLETSEQEETSIADLLRTALDQYIATTQTSEEG